MPHFSVVIAAFNSASWIVPTVRSALNQTYPDYEIIVIGDGCTDQTGDILTSNFSNAVQWKNLDRNSGGQSYPNNEGIRLSRGTHIAYLGHDDIWSPHHLEKLAGVIRTQNPDFAVSGAVFHTPPGSRYYQITGMFDDPRAAEREFFPPSSFAHRREVVDRIGLWRDPNPAPDRGKFCGGAGLVPTGKASTPRSVSMVRTESESPLPAQRAPDRSIRASDPRDRLR